MSQKIRIFTLSIISSLFLFALLVNQAEAKTLYVDPTGNDSTTYANNSASSPWRTIGRATWGSTNRSAPNTNEAAQAGDVVIVRSGTYTTPGTNLRHDPSLNIVNNGTASQPIIIKSEVVGGAVIQPEITHTGAVRSATSNSIQLDTTASTVDNFYSGGVIRITSGTGFGQIRSVYLPQSVGGGAVSTGAYVGSTRTASVQTPWTVIPDTTSRYQYITPGPIIGTNGKQYVTLDGFKVIESDSYHPDTGPVVVWDSNNITVQNFEIIGTNPPVHSDNHNGIRLNNVDNILIRNNIIRGFRAVSAGFNNTQNSAGLMTYYATNITVENNELYDVSSGFFSKGGAQSNHTYRYNKVSGCEKAFRLSYVATVNIYQNFVENCDYAFQPAEGISGVLFYNNTMVNQPWGVYNWFVSTGFEVYNNAFYNVTNPHYWEGGSGPFTSTHNSYSNFTSFIVSRAKTFAEWQALGYDTVGSLTSNPLYVSPSTGNYRLQTNSPLRNAGRGGVSIGAYITGNESIGLTTGGTTPPPPPPPQPTSDIKINGGDTAVTVNSGTSVSLSWTSTNATTCSVSPSGFTGTSGAQTVTPTINTTYTVSCTGSGGSSTDSVTVNVNPPQVVSDTTPPTVSITAPSGTVSGTVNITATASDNVTVAGVTFRVNGVAQGTEDTSSPYSVSWNTTTLANGTYTLTAVARDTSNNSATSSSVTVTVNNTVTPPPQPTADIKANGSDSTISVTPGTAVTLSWTSTNSTSCSVSPSGFTGTSGTQQVSPTATTTYTLSCTGSGGNASDSVTVNVTTISNPDPVPVTTIQIGDRVQTTAKVNVRLTPAGKRLGTQSRGAQGVVTEGPLSANGYTWYRINYVGGVDGWTRSDFLTKVSTTTLSQDEIRNSIASILLLIKQLQAQLDAMKGR